MNLSSEINLLSLSAFVLITTFTPGPNNISCASHGLRFGYGRTLPYIAGIVSGFLLLMGLCISFAAVLGPFLTRHEALIRGLGAAYISWLAWKSLGIRYTVDSLDDSRSGFAHGFFLQLVNFKAILYGLTIFGTFLMPAQGQTLLLGAFSLLFAAVTLAAVSLWTVSGAWIGEHLKDPRLQRALNVILALSLFFIAFDLSGIRLP